MQVQAITKDVRMSAQKMREMVRQIQGLPALQAQAVLKFVSRKSARVVAKTLMRTPGVADVVSFGGFQKEYHVLCDPSRLRNDGLNLSASSGSPVRASAAGEVVYAGDAVPGYGNLVLIKHPDGWVTAYGHLGSITVRMRAPLLVSSWLTSQMSRTILRSIGAGTRLDDLVT